MLSQCSTSLRFVTLVLGTKRFNGISPTIDYYRRMRLRSWEAFNFDGQEVIHHGSQTQKADPAVAAEVGAQWRWHEADYRHKWGGAPGQELYPIPYNGKP